jgi:hypothetical protein
MGATLRSRDRKDHVASRDRPHAGVADSRQKRARKGDIAVPVAVMQRYYYRLSLVIAVGHSTPSNTLYYNLVVVPCMGMSMSLLLVGHRLVAGTYKSSGHDRQLRSAVQ